MAGMAVDGLVSGLDTTSLINQLVSAEAAPQTALKTRLSATTAAATAYRTVNSRMDSLRSAAEALSSADLAAARTATSNSTDVTTSATSSAVTGSSLSFSVTAVASAHTVTSHLEWSSATADVRTPSAGGTDIGWPIQVRKIDGTADGALVGTIDVPAGATLRDAAAAINASEYGLRATVVQLAPDRFRLQVTSAGTGEASQFRLRGAGETTETAGSAFVVEPPGRDAELVLSNGLVARSSTNTFAELLTGVSVTVSKAAPTATTTVRVASDPESVAAKVQAFVDAANAALKEIRTQSSSAQGSTAVLKGDSALSSLTSEILTKFASAVDTFGSPATLGIQLKKDGTVQFDKATFLAALERDPAKVQGMLGGVPAKPGPPATEAVEGLAQRVQALAQRASDAATGTLTSLAKGRDTLAKDIQNRIADWDTRLQLRRNMLTRQFTAMETALSSLKSQSSWLAGQLASLPSSS
ncbi:flagellar hook-associated protein 2 [Geodermatophilus bullaregiensis]|uniref:flagellar filament capping protein FliD n=1 Tax=Geodermatophilus bullaregiensis TaxID=1564160 RepID=UPI00195EAB50|nr:flagellar filament capping protein FliD [Geodermatophilus bullaregiensis]MBM7807461.1 flagellar hook-associated protein 2 [Geodermatophilus bullaregiensis]